MRRAVAIVGVGIAALLEELTVGAGLVLTVVALWPLAGQTALLVPGVVLLWLGLPTRGRFLEPPPMTAKPKRKEP